MSSARLANKYVNILTYLQLFVNDDENQRKENRKSKIIFVYEKAKKSVVTCEKLAKVNKFLNLMMKEESSRGLSVVVQ